jgi:endonuclease III-like uncharacterized protein
MGATITLPTELEKKVAERAAAQGLPLEEYTLRLIEEGLTPRERTFDEILAPFRREVEESGITDEELDALFGQARRDYYREQKRHP